MAVKGSKLCGDLSEVWGCNKLSYFACAEVQMGRRRTVGRGGLEG